MQLAFGLSRAIPDDVTTAWGARLIAPSDLLHDRQDLKAATDEAKQSLMVWLNGETRGQGALRQALNYLDAHYMPQSGDVTTLYEDDRGVIVGSTNQSHGYVYVAGWLK